MIERKVGADAFLNAGQVCLAVKRAYVHSDIYEDFCAELAALAEQAVVDDGMKQGTTIGPIQNKMQYEKVKGYLEDAKAHGTIIAGGSAREGKGYFIEPTIVRDVKDGHKIVDEEQFGPILPVISFDDVDDVVARANDSEYGLVAGVWTRDGARQMRVARAIKTGQVFINNYGAGGGVELPFGGVKSSGHGREKGFEALYGFSTLKTVAIHHG